MVYATFSQDLSAVTGLLWVALAAVVLFLLLPELRKIVKSRDFSIEVAGMKLSAQRASEQAARQIEDLQAKVSDIEAELSEQRTRASSALEAGDLEGAVPDIPDSSTRPVEKAPASVPRWRPGQPSLLWVDDEPENNAFEIQALRDGGWEVELEKSTDDGLAALLRRNFDVVVSDLGRKEDGGFDPRAGLTLFRRCRVAGFSGPFVVYTSANRAATEAGHLREEGVDAVTASPTTLRQNLERFLAVAFERAVEELLKRHGFEAEEQPIDRALPTQVDFFGRVRGHRIAVEAIRVSARSRLNRVQAAAANLMLAANDPAQGVEHLLIVAPRPVESPEIKTRGQTIRIVGFEEFEEFLETLD